jgi:hypothetical protein
VKIFFLLAPSLYYEHERASSWKRDSLCPSQRHRKPRNMFWAFASAGVKQFGPLIASGLDSYSGPTRPRTLPLTPLAVKVKSTEAEASVSPLQLQDNGRHDDKTRGGGRSPVSSPCEAHTSASLKSPSFSSSRRPWTPRVIGRDKATRP